MENDGFQYVPDLHTKILNIRFGSTSFSGGVYDAFEENPGRAAAQIVIGDGNNTLEGVRDAINEAGAGVRASIVNDGSGYVLVLASERSGSSEGMEIVVTEGDANRGSKAF